MIWCDIFWKVFIEDLIEDFLYFFFYVYINQIDFEWGVIFLDKDLEQIMLEVEMKCWYVDKFFKVWFKNG